jgi:UDP-N-acetylmuramate dehydrogenase
MEALQHDLAARLVDRRIEVDAPLAPLTTFRVGGPADLLVEPASGEELTVILERATVFGVSVTMLGGGSNVLVSDGGIRGLVLRPRGGRAVEIAPGHVRADAALTINGLVRWTISHGLAGLEAWAGTPGTVGGGVHGNAHWGGRLLSERIHSVWLWSAGAPVAEIAASDMSFGYDASRLQTSGEVLIAARFVLDPGGEPDALRARARTSLAYRKGTQPLDTPSAGCIFQNPLPEVSMPSGIPRSAGALVDRAGLKGARIGGAAVSTTHGNFIVNAGGATAADILALVERCRTTVRERFGVELLDEIVLLGEHAKVRSSSDE